jgi:hypothetical protein
VDRPSGLLRPRRAGYLPLPKGFPISTPPTSDSSMRRAAFLVRTWPLANRGVARAAIPGGAPELPADETESQLAARMARQARHPNQDWSQNFP